MYQNQTDWPSEIGHAFSGDEFAHVREAVNVIRPLSEAHPHALGRVLFQIWFATCRYLTSLTT